MANVFIKELNENMIKHENNYSRKTIETKFYYTYMGLGDSSKLSIVVVNYCFQYSYLKIIFNMIDEEMFLTITKEF